MSDDDDGERTENSGPPSTPGTGDSSDPGGGVDALPRGTTLGRYAILGRIDETDADVLYAAYDAHSERKVAIKLLRVVATEDDPDEQQALVRLAREAQRIAKLDHPCIVRVFEVGVFRDRVFMAMEFIDGIDLRHWMEARDEPFPWPEVLRVFREAGRGLATAHQAGVVHRDFKPANVILGKSGRICVLNFGLAREASDASRDDTDISELRSSLPGDIVADDEDPGASQTGMTFGTPAYMAPEQHVSTKVDHRSDQFSFCVALYEALYGERPFSGNRPIALALAAVNRKVRAAPSGSDVPAWVRAVVLRGLSPLPEDRFPSMDALLGELAADPKARQRRWALGAVATVVGVAGLVGVAQLREAEKSACAPDVEALEGIWDVARRESLESSLRASERAWAGATWNTVADRANAWTDVWTQGTELVCLATRSWGTADEALYLKRRQCLDQRLGELAAMGRLLEAPSKDVVDNAHAIAMALRSPRLCRDDDAITRRPDPPEDLEERIGALSADVNDVRAFLAAGQDAVALRQATELEHIIEPLAFAPLHAEIVLLRGRALHGTGNLADAEAQLHRAAVLANGGGLEPEAAEAFIELAAVLQKRGRADEAERLTDYASGPVRRLQLWHLGPALARVQANIAVAQGKPSVALSKLYRAIKLESDRVDVHPLRLAPIWIELGALLIARGDAKTAASHFSDALAILEQSLGPQHPRVADALVELAIAQRELEQNSAAIAALTRAMDIRKQVDDVAALGMSQLRLADALLADGKASRAAVRFAEAEASLIKAGDVDRSAEAVYGRGLAELADGADAAAADTLTRAVTHAETLNDGIALADARFALARALWHDPAEHTRALSLAGLAERTYSSAGVEHATASVAVRQWAADQTGAGKEPPPDDTPRDSGSKVQPADDADPAGTVEEGGTPPPEPESPTPPDREPKPKPDAPGNGAEP
ncbi:MAG: protein kinase [Myxococcota bacterium]